jgi:RING finger protein 113A
MFRKPKRKATTRTRAQDDEQRHNDGDNDDDREKSRTTDEGGDSNDNAFAGGSDDDDNDHAETIDLFRRGNKKPTKPTSSAAAGNDEDRTSVVHSYGSGTAARTSHADLATRAAEHHHAAAGGGADKNDGEGGEEVGIGKDGIFRNKARNKFAAGPIRAQTNVRVTARFDYQPDICKDYKDTGFCGYGDTCIYLHDRGDTMSGWQLEQAWEKQQDEERKKRAQEEQVQAFVNTHSGTRSNDAAGGGSNNISDDGLPFACYLCRKAFVDPVVTNCGHYFCESCILHHVRTESELCPVCQRETHSVFNHPAKLVAKVKRVLRSAGGERSQQGHDAPSSWQAYYDLLADPAASAAMD